MARYRVVILLVTLNVVLRMIVAMRPLEYLDGLTSPDDAYLSLTLARNIAAGLGPKYGEEFTNGFQPPYVFLITFVFRLVPDDPYAAVRIALVMLAVFDSLSLVVLYNLVRRWSASALTPLLVASVWMTNPHVIGTTLNGLETLLAFFFQGSLDFPFRSALYQSCRFFDKEPSIGPRNSPRMCVSFSN